jgi:hypothetical protein
LLRCGNGWTSENLDGERTRFGPPNAGEPPDGRACSCKDGNSRDSNHKQSSAIEKVSIREKEIDGDDRGRSYDAGAELSD